MLYSVLTVSTLYTCQQQQKSVTLWLALENKSEYNFHPIASVVCAIVCFVSHFIWEEEEEAAIKMSKNTLKRMCRTKTF